MAYRDEDVFLFPQGVPGFEGQRRFLVVEQPDFAPLVFLQSVDGPDLCFLALPARVVMPDYEVALSAEDREVLGDGGGMVVLVILTVSESGPPTANLLSPVVLNPRARRGLQVVPAESPYSHQHPAFAEPPCS